MLEARGHMLHEKIYMAVKSKDMQIFNFNVPFLKLSDNIPSIQSDFPDLNLLMAQRTWSCVTQ